MRYGVARTLAGLASPTRSHETQQPGLTEAAASRQPRSPTESRQVWYSRPRQARPDGQQDRDRPKQCEPAPAGWIELCRHLGDGAHAFGPEAAKVDQASTQVARRWQLHDLGKPA